MVKGLSSVFLLYGLFMFVSAGPASDISSLKITGCGCTNGKVTCYIRQIGYALHGRVIAKYAGSQVTCSETALTDLFRIVYGWDLTCPTDSSASGQFEVSYGGGTICGRSFDRAHVQNCQTQSICSSFGR